MNVRRKRRVEPPSIVEMPREEFPKCCSMLLQQLVGLAQSDTDHSWASMYSMSGRYQDISDRCKSRNGLNGPNQREQAGGRRGYHHVLLDF